MYLRSWFLAKLLVLITTLPAAAAVFTVGSAGDHATIQAGIDAAVAMGGSNQVRVQRGTYGENLVIPSSFAGELTVSGGWNAAFSSRSNDASLTVIDGGGSDRVLDVGISAGIVELRGFTLTNGGAELLGGGGLIDLEGSAKVTLAGNRIEGNRAATDSGSVTGGGLDVSTTGASELVLSGNVIRANVAEAEGGNNAQGGGLALFSYENSRFTVQGNTIADNRVLVSANQVNGAGVYVSVFDAASGVFRSNTIRGNSAEGTGSFASAGYGGDISVSGSGVVTSRRNLWLDNTNNRPDSFGAHVDLLSDGSGTLVFGDSVVAGGNQEGLRARADDDSAIQVTNVTVANHGSRGLRTIEAEGAVSVYNSLAFGNTPEVELAAGTDSGANLVGVDPLFVNAAASDYHLRLGSPAIDAGTSAPPGGLGPSDADGNTRVVGGAVDIGAYEFDPGDLDECNPNATTLCLVGGRFKVEVTWRKPDGSSGDGQVFPLTDESGAFWFFNPENVELLVKVRRACSLAPFNNYWVFIAGLTDVQVDIVVTDTEALLQNSYHNPLGTPFELVRDTGAFDTCP